MGCCGSKQFAAEEPGAYEARRDTVLAAAEARSKANEMVGRVARTLHHVIVVRQNTSS
jgi:hypothetical protein